MAEKQYNPQKLQDFYSQKPGAPIVQEEFGY